MRGKGPDPLVVLVAVSIVALGLYTVTLPARRVFAPAGTVFTWTEDVAHDLSFSVGWDGGRLVGAFVSSNETIPWIHPAAYSGPWPKMPAHGVCEGRFDVVLPPDAYTITFFGLPWTVRITESLEVMPTRAPPGALQYASLSNGTLCSATA